MTNHDHTDPAFIEIIRDADYRKAVGLSQSMLKEFTRSPAHYLASTERIREATKAMQFGTAFHANLLTNFPEEMFAVKRKVDGRSKEGKAYNDAFALENAGKAIIDEEDFKTIEAMSQAVRSHETAGKLLLGATARECAVFGTHRGVRLKGLLDGYNKNEGIVVDLKTAEDSSPVGFRRAIRDRRYDLQVVHYTWLMQNAGLPVNNFYFIAIEKEPPFAIGIYTIHPASLSVTSVEWENAISRFNDCQKTGNYPAYSETPIEIIL